MQIIVVKRKENWKQKKDSIKKATVLGIEKKKEKKKEKETVNKRRRGRDIS